MSFREGVVSVLSLFGIHLWSYHPRTCPPGVDKNDLLGTCPRSILPPNCPSSSSSSWDSAADDTCMLNAVRATVRLIPERTIHRSPYPPFQTQCSTWRSARKDEGMEQEAYEFRHVGPASVQPISVTRRHGTAIPESCGRIPHGIDSRFRLLRMDVERVPPNPHPNIKHRTRHSILACQPHRCKSGFNRTRVRSTRIGGCKGVGGQDVALDTQQGRARKQIGMVKSRANLTVR